MLSRSEILEEWLTLYPIQELTSEQDDQGRVVVIVPHKENWLTRKILPSPKKPAGKIKLDEIGSFVWQLCDGKHSVEMICKRLEVAFKERVNPADERTIIFLQQMYREGFVRVFSKRESGASNPAS